MNKKLLALLLVLAMVVSMVPMAAMADETHDCAYDVYVSNHNGTHVLKCNVEGCTGFSMNCSDSDGDGYCACGYNLYPKHECTFGAGVTTNNDGTHNVNCSCGEYVQVGCLDNDGNGSCDSCGYVKYVHECDFAAGVTSNNDGTHNVNCSCGEYVQINCLDNDGDGNCDSCGYVKYEKCDHENTLTYVLNNNDGATHKVTCECGEVLNTAAAHSYNDQGICACGAIKPACEHKGTTYVSNNNDGATHKVTCECGVVLSEAAAHTFVMGVCPCGAINTSGCAHKGLVYVKNNEDGKTHKVTCECGELLFAKAPHKYEMGVCACGAIYTHNCDYAAGVTSNRNGTHNINCSCGNYVQVGCLDNDGNGKCDACGYVKYYNNANLDKVPRTGGSWLEWLYNLVYSIFY